MNRFLIITLLLLSTTPAWAGAAGNPPESSVPKQVIPPTLPLGAIQNRPVIEGCSCEFQQPNARARESSDAVFISGVGWEPAWIHVDKDIPLKKVSAPTKIRDRNGEKVKVVFTGPDSLKADLDLTVENACPPSQPCDTTGLKGTMTVTRGTRTTMSLVTGSCGC